MPTLNQWLNDYGESHKNQTNKTIHWVCVPAIFLSITGFLYSIKLPFYFANHHINMALLILLIILIYYFTLSKTLWIGMFVFAFFCLLICHLVSLYLFIPIWAFSILVFIAAWTGQFYGHKLEGNKPSFLKDLKFLLIGPAWLMSFIYQKVGIEL